MEINFLYIFLGIFLIYVLYNYLIINIIFETNNIYKIIDYVITKILYIKIYIQKIYQKIYNDYFLEKGFKIKNIILIDNNCNNVTSINENYLNNFDKLNCEVYKKLIYDTFDYNKSVGLINYFDINDNNLYIKIVYNYDNVEYIFIYNNEMARNNVTLPMPLYSEEIIENFKKDIINPYYGKHNKDASLYGLFHIDCKRIKSVRYNNVENEMLLNAINKYKGLFNDFGLMYKSKVKVCDILNYYELEYLEKLEIEFEAPYFDEITFDIIPHIIEIKDKNDYIISDRIKSILDKREKDKNE